MKADTIVAIATSMTNSGIGIIRMSGQDTFKIIDKVYQSKKNIKKLSKVKSHTIHYGFIVDKDEIIDEVMVLVMRGPNSYTTEDTVEIDCHGGILVVNKILELLIKNGGRPADPGEFTKRAFLNGRIDLSQAEAVIDVINAKNDFALKSSMNQLKGYIYDKVKTIRQKVIHEIAFIESALDDPEHVSIEGYGEQLFSKLEPIIIELEKIIATSDNGRMMKEGIKTVIVGKPNAGKSSLLNLLLKEDRAIVTDVAGTTRDILEESIQLNGISLNIVDTAGIRDTEDIVEKIGVKKAKEYLALADLVLYVVDSSTPFDKNDNDIMELLEKQQGIILLNKSDLKQITDIHIIKKKTNKAVIEISTKENKGIDILENTIRNMFFEGKVSFNDEIFITNARHKSAFIEALNSLKLVLQSIECALPEDFYSIDLMNAYECLGMIIGESIEDDLVNEIFSKFCTGK